MSELTSLPPPEGLVAEDDGQRVQYHICGEFNAKLGMYFSAISVLVKMKVPQSDAQRTVGRLRAVGYPEAYVREVVP